MNMLVGIIVYRLNPKSWCHNIYEPRAGVITYMNLVIEVGIEICKYVYIYMYEYIYIYIYLFFLFIYLFRYVHT